MAAMKDTTFPVYAWTRLSTPETCVEWAAKRHLAVTLDWGESWACAFCFQPWTSGHACAQIVAWRHALAAYAQQGLPEAARHGAAA